MKIFIAALIFIGLSVFGLCFNIIFRKNGKFPETEISRNKEMRKLGIRCAKEDELRNNYVKTFYTKEKGESLAKDLGTDPKKTVRIMIASYLPCHSSG